MAIPFVAVIQDHGFGGGYARYDKGGLLNKYADKYQVYPDYLLVAENSIVWDGYEKVTDKSVIGGMHHMHRYLYKKS